MVRPLLLALGLWPLFASAQNWHVYLTSSTINDLDVSGNTLLVGVDQRVASVNTTTLQAALLTPPASSNGDEVFPVRYVAIDSSGAFWASISAYGNGLYRYANGTWDRFIAATSDLPGDFPAHLFADRAHSRLWVDCAPTGTFDGATFNAIGNYSGPLTATSNGDLWIANGDGLYRYDGVTVQLFDTADSDLPHPSVDHITCDASDRLWFSMPVLDTLTWYTHTTIGLFDGMDWQEFNDTNSTLPSITEQVVDLCIDPNGALVIATGDRLIEFDGMNTVEYSHALGNFPDVQITALAIGADGTRWIGTTTEGLLRMQGGVTTSVDLGDDPLTGNRLYTVLVDQQGRVWAGTDHHNNSYTDRGIVMLDDTTWTVWSESHGDVPGSAHAIEMDPFGNIFIAGATGVYKRTGNTWQSYCTAGGAGFANSDIAIDGSGTAWLQYYYYTGLLQCDGGGGSTTLTTPVGGSHLRCVEYDVEGDLWVGAQNALAVRDTAGDWTVYDGANAFPVMGLINDIERDAQGDVWVAGNDLYHFDGTTWTDIPHPVISSGWMDDLEIQPDGVIWVAMGVYGLGRYDGSSWMVWDHTNSPLICDYVVEISLDPARHRLWGATYGGGLFYLEDQDLVMGSHGPSHDNNELSVFPVPARDRMIVRTPKEGKPSGTLALRSITGALIGSFPVTGTETSIPLSGIAPGPYTISLSTPMGRWHGRAMVE